MCKCSREERFAGLHAAQKRILIFSYKKTSHGPINIRGKQASLPEDSLKCCQAVVGINAARRKPNLACCRKSPS